MLLLSVVVVSSDRFQISRSFSSCPFLCALGTTMFFILVNFFVCVVSHFLTTVLSLLINSLLFVVVDC